MKTKYSYAAVLTKDSSDTLLVTFPDVPEAASVGDNEEHALAQAKDALESALQIYEDERRVFPQASDVTEGQHLVTVEL